MKYMKQAKLSRRQLFARSLIIGRLFFLINYLELLATIVAARTCSRGNIFISHSL